MNSFIAGMLIILSLYIIVGFNKQNKNAMALCEIEHSHDTCFNALYN